MERAGFEVRDVESLREHYATTLRNWVANLERNWDRAVELVGQGRARVWLLYMSGSINSFDDNRIAIHQVLGGVPDRPAPATCPPPAPAGTPELSDFSSVDDVEGVADRPVERGSLHLVEPTDRFGRAPPPGR